MGTRLEACRRAVIKTMLPYKSKQLPSSCLIRSFGRIFGISFTCKILVKSLLKFLTSAAELNFEISEIERIGESELLETLSMTDSLKYVYSFI